MDSDEENIPEPEQQISNFYHGNFNVNEAINIMKCGNISAELVKSVYDQLLTDAENLTKKRFHYYTYEVYKNLQSYRVECWTSRYLISYDTESTDSAFHEIEIIDSFNDKSMKIKIEKIAKRFDIYPLKDGFGLLSEKIETNWFISLIFLDIHQHTLKKLSTIEHSSQYIQIVANKTDPTKFIWEDDKSWKFGKIVNEKIVIFEDATKIGFYPGCFYANCFYGLNWYKDKYGEEIPQFHIYNIEQKTENKIDLELPAHCFRIIRYVEFMCDNAFLWLERENGMIVIGCLNIQTRQLDILDFSLKLIIQSIYGFEKGSLVVRTKSNNSKEHFLYNIPFGKPDLLENTAWFILVKTMKKCETVEDPYEAARKYLPPNSSINCPFENS